MTTKVIIKTGCLLLQPAQTLRNSDNVRRCDGIFKRRVQTKNSGILHKAMRIMVQIKVTLVLKKILVYIEVHEFSE